MLQSEVSMHAPSVEWKVNQAHSAFCRHCLRQSSAVLAGVAARIEPRQLPRNIKIACSFELLITEKDGIP